MTAQDLLSRIECEIDRDFVCEGCGSVLDQDYNAAINIKTVGVNAVTLVERL